MKKRVFITLAIATLLIGFYFVFSKGKDQTDSQQSFVEDKQESLVTLSIEAGGKDKIEYQTSLEDGMTAYSLLKKASEEQKIPIQTTQYDFGVFVNSINNLESSAEMAWIYFVNGASGDVAADQKSLNPGDFVEWKFVPPSE